MGFPGICFTLFLILISLNLTSFANPTLEKSVASHHKKVMAQDIVRFADEARCPKGSLSFTVKVVDSEGGSASQETVYRVHTQDSEHSLVETKEPERLRGRKLLMRGEDLWLYLPSIKRPTRIGLDQRLTGEVSNGDLARTNYSNDYNARFLKIEKIDNHECFKLLLTAKKKSLPYRKISYWVERKTYFPVRVEFFALSGKVLKIGTYSLPQEVFKKQRVTQFIIQDAANKTHQSILTYSDFKREKFDASFFSKETLGD